MTSTVQFKLKTANWWNIYIQVMVFLELDLEEKIAETDKENGYIHVSYFWCHYPYRTVKLTVTTLRFCSKLTFYNYTCNIVNVYMKLYVESSEQYQSSHTECSKTYERKMEATVINVKSA